MRDAPAQAPDVAIWHVAFPVEALDRSIAFYCAALGFELVSRDAESAFVSLGHGGFTLEFLVGDSSARKPHHLAFEARDLKTMRARLVAVGAKVSTISVIGPRARRLATQDPDGLRIDLFEARDEIEAAMREPMPALKAPIGAK